ncbi:MAG TPA: hypothetical protein VNF71_14835 [Acidimicrobiales bacterium]|nr:hypothetical protein [Acidimicrobiales bacterium]
MRHLHHKPVGRMGSRQLRSGPSPATGHGLLELQRLAGNQAVTKLLGSRPALSSAAQSRFDAFVSAAQSAGLGLRAAQQLWAIGGGAGTDPVTGFDPVGDRTADKQRVVDYAAEAGGKAFSVDVDVGNLAGFNAAMGHTGADAVFGEMANMVQRHLSVPGAQVQAARSGGSKLSFTVVAVGSEEAASLKHRLDAAVSDARVQLRGYVRNAGLADTPNPKGASGPDVNISVEEIAAQAPAIRSGPTSGGPEQATDLTGGGFVGSGADRRRRFVVTAMGFGVTAEAAAGLYKLTSGGQLDPLTGFAPAGDRLPTIDRAAAYTGETGYQAAYVEVDIRNLGGLNAALGRDQADDVLRTLSTTVEQRLGPLGTVAAFRHGGDEVSFVVVATRSLADHQLVSDVRGVLSEAATQGRSRYSHLEQVEHPKYPGDRTRGGTGIAFGVAAITPGSDPLRVCAAADLEVEDQKRRTGRAT